MFAFLSESVAPELYTADRRRESDLLSGRRGLAQSGGSGELSLILPKISYSFFAVHFIGRLK
jgi:hypothetical protein